MTTRKIDIRVPTLSRVEGEGALELGIEDGRLTDLRLRIYEPPRYFEKLLEGRSHADLPDIEARICGICPAAYQLTAVRAVEAAFGMQLPDHLVDLRRLLYCGEWIQSHCLHIHLLAAPDFLGFENAIAMSRDHGEFLDRGMRLQNLGNRIMEWLGGRSVHPVNVRTGGFHKLPDPRHANPIRRDLDLAWDESAQLLQWTTGLGMPDAVHDIPQVSLRHGEEYPLYSGRIVSTAGLDIDADGYPGHFAEAQVPWSTALHSMLDGKPYMVGPLARINLNLDRLPAEVLEPLGQTAIRFPSLNPYHAIVARAVEVRYCIHLARELFGRIDYSAPPSVAATLREGTGAAATEAPRGLLWHQYSFASDGSVREARIVPPTSQNQACIEADLRRSLLAFGLDREEDEIRRHAEQVIRNYDPCISCATHFLDLRITSTADAPETGIHVTDARTALRLRVIGVGSPQPPDDLGWKVLECLRNRVKGREVEFIRLDRPGPRILPNLEEDACNIVIDALRPEHTGSSPVWVRASQLVPGQSPISGHLLGVADLLHLAEQAGTLPGNTWVVGLPAWCRDEAERLADRLAERIGELQEG